MPKSDRTSSMRSLSRVCSPRRSWHHALHSTWRTWEYLRRVSNSILPIRYSRVLMCATLSRNPLGCAVAITALQVLVDEDLAARAERLGKVFRSSIEAINSPLVKTVRGRGLLNAVVIDESKSLKGRTAWQLCLLLKSRGLLAKPTHVNM